jgi:hypothetical protein
MSCCSCSCVELEIDEAESTNVGLAEIEFDVPGDSLFSKDQGEKNEMEEKKEKAMLIQKNVRQWSHTRSYANVKQNIFKIQLAILEFLHKKRMQRIWKKYPKPSVSF